MKLCYIATVEDTGKAIKELLSHKLDISGSLIKRLKFNHKIFSNSLPVHVNVKVTAGDVIEVEIDFIEDCDAILSEKIDLDILYEDESLLIINKQPFMVVHPTCGHQSGTVANGIMYHLAAKGIFKKIRPVSRLDRDTSGIILFAKNEYVQEFLIRQMKDKTFVKEYVGVVHGSLDAMSGTINLPIDRKPDSIMLRQISESGATAITHYQVLEQLKDATFLKFVLETGRTHQIRVHCQAIGHPLVGETLYPSLTPTIPSPLSEEINRQALHSTRVSFTHPLFKYPVEFSAPLPNDIAHLLEITRK